ncbi:hypothetical protein EDF54_2157 [Rathayibacter sp. PhB93]|uniref:hypothetical protein n=1 Tax=unclassified Rathayibacter TaxID=2609250 RepID=UPI000FADC9E8|nr:MULTISPECIES: hypothetical protein [unclassified Rathayibacter]ROQ05538.1 hypothetical protein EDF54_2157 [Rathayibacter sp. PhB93]TDQ12391.1 hypothetical protein EDF17_2250 [Rathayibacter sp. PhB1]
MTLSPSDAYRRALRWYPAAWREANAESVIGAFLDRDDATRAAGPTPRNRAELALAGIRETLTATSRPGRRAGSAIGVVFLLAAWTYVSVVIEVGGRDMTFAQGGFVDLMGRSYAFPVLLAAATVALAWLCTAITASRRGRPLLAAVIGLCGLGAAWTTFHLSWSSLVPPLELGSPLLTMGALSVTALAAPLLATVSAVRAGLLEKRVSRIIGVAAAVHVAGAALLAALDRPFTVPEVLLVVACALLAPAYLAVTGVSFVFLSTGTTRERRASRQSARTAP